MEEKTIVGKEKNAAEEKTILEDDIEIRDCSDLAFEIDMPGSVLATLNVHPEKGSVRFVEENGRVYLERSGGAYLKEVKADETQKYNNEDLLNAEDSIQKTECSMQIAEEIENLTFLDGVLVTWDIFNKILDKRLRDDNGEPEGVIYKGRKYDYLGIIDDDVNDLLLNKVLEHGYFKHRGEQLRKIFELPSYKY